MFSSTATTQSIQLTDVVRAVRAVAPSDPTMEAILLVVEQLSHVHGQLIGTFVLKKLQAYL